jgi:pimeloyl-ACP methyl ester carboxylesterase
VKILIVIAFVLALMGVLLFEGDVPAEQIDAQYSNDASQFLDLGCRGRIHFRDQGVRDGPGLGLVHGSYASLHTWEGWVEELGDQFRLISLDLPAHGLTGATPGQDYTMDAYVDVVHSIAEHQGLGNFFIAGNSMGGGVAIAYALEYPANVEGLVLIDSVGLPLRELGSQDSGREAPIAFSLLRQPWFQAVAARIDPYYLAVQGARSAYNNSPVVNDELIQRYYDLHMRAGTRDATIMRFRQISARSLDIESLTPPVLIMWGREDALIPFSVAERFKELLPEAETAFYDDVGHVPMEEIPHQSAIDVARFIEGLR